jgi:hypothetical protein
LASAAPACTPSLAGARQHLSIGREHLIDRRDLALMFRGLADETEILSLSRVVREALLVCGACLKLAKRSNIIAPILFPRSCAFFTS